MAIFGIAAGQMRVQRSVHEDGEKRMTFWASRLDSTGRLATIRIELCELTIMHGRV